MTIAIMEKKQLNKNLIIFIDFIIISLNPPINVTDSCSNTAGWLVETNFNDMMAMANISISERILPLKSNFHRLS